MELLLQRFSSGEDSSLGIMHSIDDYDEDRRFQCFTMEDQHNEPKVPGETRIPAGRYRVGLRGRGGMNDRYSKKFDWHRGMLWLQDVHDFTFVYIHYGNYHGDTEGCILVGDGSQSNVEEDGMVTSSVTAYTRLAQEIYAAYDDGDEVWINIEDFA